MTPIQLINAYAALANGGTLYQPQIVREIVGPDGDGRPAVRAEGHPQDGGPAERPQDDAQRGPQRRHVRHTYNLVDLPIKVAGKSGTAEFGTRDSKGRLPFHSWFVGFVPEGPGEDGAIRRLKAIARGLEARRPRLRLRLADEGQRRRPRS